MRYCLGFCFLYLISQVHSYFLYSRNGEVYRLPKSIKPHRYTLTVEPDLDPNLKLAPYNGSVIIEFEVVENTKNITFHARAINIDKSSLKVTNSNHDEILISAVSSNVFEETCTVSVNDDLESGKNYTLTIGNFDSTLGMQNVGFYLATYKDNEGNERRVALTDFEPNDARQAFPCFDEPGIKATFVINLIRKQEFSSLSNEELDKTVDLGNGRYQDCYKETPRMSAYIVAFIISDFESTDLKERHTIFARPGVVQESKLNYSLDISVKLLTALEDFTGIKFPIKKMQQFAIPDEYFKDDAMENWAIIIYGESNLFCDKYSTTDEMKICTYYIAHEFAHQWFGNLVTPSWWKYTWLSESFAGYFQFYASSLVQPTWRFMDQIVIETLHSALDRDDTNFDTRSLNYEISYNGEFPMLWLLYHKGSSIIRMTEHFLTHDVFKQGLRNFLNERKYDSAEPSHLYNGLQKALDQSGLNFLGNLDVATILKTWDSQQGYPVVNVIKNYETNTITFSQTKFTRPNTGSLEGNPLWHIPISYAFGTDPEQKFSKTSPEFWLSEKEQTIKTNFTADDWLLVNIQQTGYYRVNYDTKNWENLIDILNNGNFEKIPILNRAQLLDDAFDLAQANQLSFDIALKLSEYLIRERDYIPFAAFFSFVDAMENILPYQSTVNPDEYLYFKNYQVPNSISSNGKGHEVDLFKEYAKYILQPIFEYLGFEEKPSDQYLDKVLRKRVINWLCNNKHTECINGAIKMFKKFQNDRTIYIASDLLKTIFYKGITSQEDFDFALTAYNTTNRENKALKDGIRYGLRSNYKYCKTYNSRCY